MADRPQRPQKLSNRTLLNQRQTMNMTNPNLRGSVQPVSTFVQPDVSDAGAKAQRLAGALGVVGDQLNNMQPFLKDYAEKQYELGKSKALKGEEDVGEGYFQVKAFEETKGGATARREYRLALNEYYNENHGVLDPEEFQEGLEQLAVDYMEGQTDNFINGFAPVAQGLETQALVKYQGYVQEEAHKEKIKQTRALIDGEANLVLDQIIKNKFGDTAGYEDLESFINSDITNYVTFFKDEDNLKTVNTALRQVLTMAQEQGKEMKLNRREVTEQFVDQIIRVAVNKGIPEILDVMYMEDEAGISIVDGLLGNTIDDERRRLEAGINRQIENAEIEAQKNKDLKEKADAKQKRDEMELRETQRFNETYTGLLDISEIENKKERIDALDKFKDEYLRQDGYFGEKDNWYITQDNSKYTQLQNLVQEIETMEDPVEDEKIVEDNEALAGLYKKLTSSDPVNTDAIVTEINNLQNKGKIKPTTAKTLLRDFFEKDEEIREMKKEEASAKLEFKDEDDISRLISLVSPIIATKGERYIPTEQIDRNDNLIKKKAWEGIRNFKKEKGRYPTYEEFKEGILSNTADSFGYSLDRVENSMYTTRGVEGKEMVDDVMSINKVDIDNMKPLEKKWWGNVTKESEDNIKKALEDLGFTGSDPVEVYESIERPTTEVINEATSRFTGDRDKGIVGVPAEDIFNEWDNTLHPEVAQHYKLAFIVNSVVHPYLDKKDFKGVGDALVEIEEAMETIGIADETLVDLTRSYLVTIYDDVEGNNENEE